MNGVVVIDKPSGFTSHDVVQKVKRLFNAKKAGHTGTLDPLATGVLPVCLNGATKRQEELMLGEKEYIVEMIFGATSTTLDSEGELTNKCPVPANFKEAFRGLIGRFTGMIEQKPPYFSAIKHQGKPLYKWAREGKLIDLPSRTVEVKEFELIKTTENSAICRILCTKGTYIRSICHDIGALLGCGGYMGNLRRTMTGPFTLNDAVTVSKLELAKLEGKLENYIKNPFTNKEMIC